MPFTTEEIKQITAMVIEQQAKEVRTLLTYADVTTAPIDECYELADYSANGINPETALMQQQRHNNLSSEAKQLIDLLERPDSSHKMTNNQGRTTKSQIRHYLQTEMKWSAKLIATVFRELTDFANIY